jgi:hypothetical protein
MPFNGKTTNHATALGRIAPSPTQAIQYAYGARDRSMKRHRTTAHTPPQNASETTAGTWNGHIGVVEYGARVVKPAA